MSVIFVFDAATVCCTPPQFTRQSSFSLTKWEATLAILSSLVRCYFNVVESNHDEIVDFKWCCCLNVIFRSQISCNGKSHLQPRVVNNTPWRFARINLEIISFIFHFILGWTSLIFIRCYENDVLPVALVWISRRRTFLEDHSYSYRRDTTTATTTNTSSKEETLSNVNTPKTKDEGKSTKRRGTTR